MTITREFKLDVAILRKKAVYNRKFPFFKCPMMEFII